MSRFLDGLATKMIKNARFFPVEPQVNGELPLISANETAWWLLMQSFNRGEDIHNLVIPPMCHSAAPAVAGRYFSLESGVARYQSIYAQLDR